MKGVIAGGAEATVQAGSEVLQAGGNAVDAAVAACFATSAGEPTLTSLAGAGALLHRSAETGEVTVCDFFANAPGLGAERQGELDFVPVDLDFGPTQQRFYIGAGSSAVPGAIPGLCTTLERWGRLPMEEVVRPACRLLREGAEIKPFQAGAAALLEPILLYSEEGRRVFAPEGKLMGQGHHFHLPQLADTLEQMAVEGWRKYHAGVIEPAMLEQYGPAAGGLLTAEDLAAYEVAFLRPLELTYSEHTLYTNPAPALGGRMIALMLSLLEGGNWPEGSEERIHAFSRAMRVTDEARAAGLHELDPARLPRWRSRFEELEELPLGAGPKEPGGPGSTSHISVIDAEGSAATVTFSYGEGNGSFIGNTGIMMNNLMGEEDLFPDGFHLWEPGTRLTTMVSPSVLVSPEGAITALGSGGANRIRTAMTQVISALVDRGQSAEEAVRAARIHFEAGVLNAETFEMEDGGKGLERLGADKLVCFDHLNLFFGGLHMVRRKVNGDLEAAGDPRRGGVARVV